MKRIIEYRITRIFFYIFMIVLLLVVAVIARGNRTKKAIKAFTDRGVFVCSIGNVEYYKVPKKYSYEDANGIIDGYGDHTIGTIGDIYVNDGNPMGIFGGDFVTKRLFIGHGSIVSDNDGSHIYEIMGYLPYNYLKESDNGWYGETITINMVVLRPKQVNKEILVDYLKENEGAKYNFFFITHPKHRFYCLDLLSRSLRAAGSEVENNIATLGCDFICSDELYMIYYKECIGYRKYRIYYLSEN